MRFSLRDNELRHFVNVYEKSSVVFFGRVYQAVHAILDTGFETMIF